MQLPTVLIVAGFLISGGAGQSYQLQGVRLAPSLLGSHAGRVEVMYNGRWGTICDRGWSLSGARTVCRMLGFTSGALCAVSRAVPPFGPGSGPVWLRNLQCGYSAKNITDCRHDGVRENWCSHSNDAAVICQDISAMPVADYILSETTTINSMDLMWAVDFIPAYLRALNFYIYYRDTRTSILRVRSYRTEVNGSSTVFNFTLTGLRRNRTYEVYIKTNGEYSLCRYRYIYGNNSQSVMLTTNATVLPSTLPMRLIPNIGGPSNVGRLEVLHDGEWGTVCDDSFGPSDADLACYGLNYTNGALCYATNGITSGVGRIWLDDVNCVGAMRFEDCTHRGWGVNNCVHSEDIGLICDTGHQNVIPPVTNFRTTAIGYTTISLEWDHISSFVGRYRIEYKRPDQTFAYTRTVYAKSVILSRLVLGVNYTLRISSQNTLYNRYSGNCYSAVAARSQWSDPIYATPQESAPNVSTSSFHVIIVNRSAVELSWTLPSIRYQLNGIVRAYKLYVQRFNGSAREITLMDNTTFSYIITKLEPLAQYTFSMLIKTVEDGPRGIHLDVIMPDSDFIPSISVFGVNGNGLESVRRYTFNRGFNVLCGSSVANTTVHWQHTNGSRIGIANRGFREGRFQNGTAVLQVGTAQLYARRLTLCDGGVYTCVATSATGGIHKRNFTLTIGSSPPVLDSPHLIRKGPTWIQVGWDVLSCNGGYQIKFYEIQYRLQSAYAYNSYSVAARVSNLNYTIKNLIPNSAYDIRIRLLSRNSPRYSYSPPIFVVTFPQGPSAPSNLVVTVTISPEVCLRWRRAHVPRGSIALYKVYAEPITASRDIHIGADLPVTEVIKKFHGNVQFACMKLHETNVLHQFRMSAVAYVDGVEVEGELSEVTPQSIVFIPKLGIPQPKNIQLQSLTNTSAYLTWEPSNSTDLLNYKVSYSATVQWTTPFKVFIQFPESGELLTTNTHAHISPLTPSTSYVFRVSMMTVKGDGPQVVLTNTTLGSQNQKGKLAYFQLQIINSEACNKWINTNSNGTLEDIKRSVVSVLNGRCRCGLTLAHISQAEFSCRKGDNEKSINYRARIKGTSNRSTSDLVALLQSWVQSGEASVLVSSFRFNVDESCDPMLDNIHALGCGSKSTTTTTQDTQIGSSKDSNNSAEVGGIIIGGILVGIFLALFAVALIFLIFWIKKKNLNKKDPQLFNELINTPSNRNSAAFGDDSDMTEKL